jgi:hypothetical protein
MKRLRRRLANRRKAVSLRVSMVFHPARLPAPLHSVLFVNEC